MINIISGCNLKSCIARHHHLICTSLHSTLLQYIVEAPHISFIPMHNKVEFGWRNYLSWCWAELNCAVSRAKQRPCSLELECSPASEEWRHYGREQVNTSSLPSESATVVVCNNTRTGTTSNKIKRAVVVSSRER